MKKILTLAALTGLTLSVFGQGQVQFNNRLTSATPTVDAKIFLDAVGTVALDGSNTLYRAALIGGATTGTASSASAIGTLSLLASPSSGNTWTTFRTGAAAGYVGVGTDVARDSGLPYGSTGLFQVVAWVGTETTWAAAYADWKSGLIKAGFSNALTLPTSTGPTDLAVPTLAGLQAFAVTSIPEPSTFALAGMGVAAMMIFRRRKQ